MENDLFISEHTQGQVKAAALGLNLKRARTARGFSQAALSRLAHVPRLRLVRMEGGRYVPRLDEALQIAGALKIPLSLLINGSFGSPSDLRGIAVELFHLGIGDLEVADARVPGEFRRVEEILACALRGDRPEPRVVEAVPIILAQHRLEVPLALAFADVSDPRAPYRLAWLADITLALQHFRSFPFELKTETQLGNLIRRVQKPKEPDSLGHPGKGKLPRIWLRWNITYAATLDSFLQRAIEVSKIRQGAVHGLGGIAS